MVEIEIQYQGALRCQATHTPSQNTLQSDAPKDNQGKGESFSPTDLVATALGTCMATMMDIVARKHDFDITGTTVKVVKQMINEPVRRVDKLTTTITFPQNYDDHQKKLLQTTAKNCPVAKSIHPDINVPVDFIYPD